MAGSKNESFTSQVFQHDAFGNGLCEYRAKIANIEPDYDFAPGVTLAKDNVLAINSNTSQEIRVKLDVLRPNNPETNPSGDYATVIYIPGTAFTASPIKVSRTIASYMSSLTGCQVIMINHSLAPENSPARIVDEVVSTVKSLTTQLNSQFKIDTSRVTVAGYSSGGNLAANVAFRAKELNLPLKSVFLICPALDLTRSNKNFRHCEEQDPVVNDDFVKDFIKTYLTSIYTAENPLVSPLLNKKGLKNSIPMSVFVGEFDRFRGDAEALSRNECCQQLFIHNNGNHGSFWHDRVAIEDISSKLRHNLGLFRMPQAVREKGALKKPATDPMNCLAQMQESKSQLECSTQPEWSLSSFFKFSRYLPFSSCLINCLEPEDAPTKTVSNNDSSGTTARVTM